MSTKRGAMVINSDSDEDMSSTKSTNSSPWLSKGDAMSNGHRPADRWVCSNWNLTNADDGSACILCRTWYSIMFSCTTHNLFRSWRSLPLLAVVVLCPRNGPTYYYAQSSRPKTTNTPAGTSNSGNHSKVQTVDDREIMENLAILRSQFPLEPQSQLVAVLAMCNNDIDRATDRMIEKGRDDGRLPWGG